ncbi:MAG: tRNA (N6-isopentenyl adenosine(37)-C2)-methylthiotransferase MiaB [Clostridia bacterium]|nr:tRNA (N6-isopentenyl adenosine(37)-C2)-methylthiotransferase MiaB [Clostridia bacterium]
MKKIEDLKYMTQTWGCQMNERDTEMIQCMLEDMGMKEVDNVDEADLVVLITCCVREKAEHKVYARLGELSKIKRSKSDLIIAVGGCMTQQEEVGERIKKRFSGVDIIFGTHNIDRIPELIKRALLKKERVLEVWEKEKGIPEERNIYKKRKNFLKSKVIISYGCNNFCSYCIVPFVRGRERSRKPEAIISEIEYLAENGCVEVMLLGQNVNSYGKDFREQFDFSDLLRRVVEIKGIERIRFMTSHPKDFSNKLIKTIADFKKICNHIHLPVQAGSNKILKNMNRVYTQEEYLSLVSKIKTHIPGVSITTDIIVGFPGETREDFHQTLKVVKEVEFDNAYMFIYSPRQGTLAAEKYEDNIPLEEKKERLQELMELQNKISLKINKKLLGKNIEVLIDSVEEKDGKKVYSGRTETNKIVNIQGNDFGGELYGTFQNVEIISAQTWSLGGKLSGSG